MRRWRDALGDVAMRLLGRDAAGLPIALLVAGAGFGAARVVPPGMSAAVGTLYALLAFGLALASLRHLHTRARARRAHPPPGKLIDLGGYRVHVLAEGEAVQGRPPVVWFAGGHAGGHAMHHLHRALRGDTRSILIDRPGTGWSDTGPFVWAGHSFGGLLAANVARRRPDLVHTLVLLDPTPLETIVFGPRLGALKEMQREAWLGGLAQLFGVNLQARRQARQRQSPAQARVLDAVLAVLGPQAVAAREVEANAGFFFAQASIYRELTPEGVAAVAWDTVVYDRDLGDLPVWLVAPREDTDAEVAALPEAQQAAAAAARRMARFFAATRERYLATSTRSRRVVAPAGSGHNFVYEAPDWTIGVMRELICAATRRVGEPAS